MQESKEALLQVYVPEAMHYELKCAAAKERSTLKELVTHIADEYLQKMKKRTA